MKFVGAIPQSLIGVGTGTLSENINHPINYQRQLNKFLSLVDRFIDYLVPQRIFISTYLL